ncbi:MAG TPA: hypothetical protein VIK89_05470, partial [Cytophagaceae bacterium]
FNLNYHVSPHIAIMPELSMTRLMGDDFSASKNNKEGMSDYYIRNLHFRNDILSLSLLGQYDFYPNKEQYRRRPIHNFYAIAGISGVYSNPQAKDLEGKWVDLRKYKTENKSYSSFSVALPVGAGFRYKLAISWDLEIEFTYNLCFSDYLDDVSGNYIDPLRLSSETAGYLSNRSAEEFSSLTGDMRDWEFIENVLEQKIVQLYPNYRYIEGSAPGDLRGNKKGPDRYVVVTFRFLHIFPGGKINCPKFRD